MNNVIARATLPVLLAATLALPAYGDATVPPRFVQTVQPRFPAALQFTAISEGAADLILKIDSTGRLVDAMVAGYTEKEFGDEAVVAVRQWKFEPAFLNGAPVGARLRLDMKFTSDSRVVTLKPVETPAALLRRGGVLASVDLVCPARDLDRPLEVLQAATPVHPGKSSDFKDGRTVVDFFVDESGLARVPVIVETTGAEFSSAAIDALGQWRFAVPTRNGRPVIVRMRQMFVFSNET